MRKQILFILLFSSRLVIAQNESFSKYDSAHGSLNNYRSCYDVTHYNITLETKTESKFILGSNTISFKALHNFKVLQLDFYASMRIDSILFNNRKLTYIRDSTITYVNFPDSIKKSETAAIQVYFSGRPIEAIMPPWDGGFDWQKDTLGNPWVGMACEGKGAFIWLPCKDHWSDEPDSMSMTLIVPDTLVAVSNGKNTRTFFLDKHRKAYEWKVNNPINLYSIAINIAKYASFNDTLLSNTGVLPLQYYVLEYNLSKAKEHFKQVKGMLTCFEHYLGPYPFYNDSYKLVETPYWGMEHQSCVAYGNNYLNNAYGFDFIIIHESAHEWFANSITANDQGDMWIHESFTTYAEALFVECQQGYKKALDYLKEQKQRIKNTNPIRGPLHVYYDGYSDNDMYFKGAWMLHTFRSVVNNDSLFFSTLRNFVHSNRHKIIGKDDVIEAFNKIPDLNWKALFNAYLLYSELPKFEYKVNLTQNKTYQLEYRWKCAVKDFNMPLQITWNNSLISIQPNNMWQVLETKSDLPNVKVSTEAYLISVSQINASK